MAQTNGSGSCQTQPLRILHVIPSLRKGGAERLAIDICTELLQRPGVEVVLATMYDHNDYSYLSTSIPVEVCHSRVIPSLRGKPTVAIDEFSRMLLRFKPHVIHSHLFEAEMLSRWQLINGVKYFTHCHDNMHQMKRLSVGELCNKKRLTERYEKWLIEKRYASCNNQFIAISSDTYRYFSRQLPLSLRANIHLLRNAIHVGRFTRDLPHDPGESIRLVTIGSLVTKKNQIFLVDVVDLLAKRGIEVSLLILGDGPQRDLIQSRIREAGIEARVTMAGNVDAVETYLHQSNVYVHAATYEPFGLVLLEAMAAGLPVLTLDGGGNRDLIIHGKNGFMIEDRDPAVFADAVIELFRDKTLYRDMSARAREFATGFDIKEYVDRLLELYRA